MSDATETVKFNVGGRHFEVSRALIEGHSDTVLGKLVSDTWNDDPDKAVILLIHTVSYISLNDAAQGTTNMTHRKNNASRSYYCMKSVKSVYIVFQKRVSIGVLCIMDSKTNAWWCALAEDIAMQIHCKHPISQASTSDTLSSCTLQSSPASVHWPCRPETAGRRPSRPPR